MEIPSPSPRIGLLLGPTLFLFLLVAPSQEGLSPLAQRMTAVVVLMAVFWITEALPIAVKALLPLALYPLLGIAHQQADCLGLQQPLALLVYRRLSDCRRFAEVEPASAHLAVDYSVDWCRSQADYVGFYAGTAFLSMWISNSPTPLMMWPVALAVVVELAQSDAQGRIERSFGTVLMLAIAYAGHRLCWPSPIAPRSAA